MNQVKCHKIANILGLIFVCGVLIITADAQWRHHDLPCPLCLMQRLCFIAIGLSMCLNLKEGIKTSHYGVMTLAAILGLIIALRQTSLHLAPNDPGYGQIFLGFHMYIWSAITFTIILGLVGVGLLLEKGFSNNKHPMNRWQLILITLFLCLILANGISTLVECEALVCKDPPLHHHFLKPTTALNRT
jgi:disulfide bond formation protein DsbB